MKKNTMMRVASVLLVAVLLSTCVISSTFAKYTTQVSSSDSARVAYWGFQSSNTMDITGLFAKDYTDVTSKNDKDVIAPGTNGSVSFQFLYDESVTANTVAQTMTGPEVDYNFTISVVANCDAAIQENKNIVWKLNGGSELTWPELIEAIVELSGATNVTYVNNGTTTATVRYEANSLPPQFNNDQTHTISWEWKFDGGNNEYAVDGQQGSGTDGKLTQDEYDTYMGNMEEMDDVSIEITINATQVNDAPVQNNP